MTLTRRAALAGAAALAATAGRAAPPLSAAVLAARVAAPRDASDLLLRDEQGVPVPLSDHAGRLVVLSLWAPWCIGCRREMPSLDRMAAAVHGAPISVLPLAFVRKAPEDVRRFYESAGVQNLPILTGDGQNLWDVLMLERLPTTAILDAQSRHIATVAGEAIWDDALTLDWLLELAG